LFKPTQMNQNLG